VPSSTRSSGVITAAPGADPSVTPPISNFTDFPTSYVKLPSSPVSPLCPPEVYDKPLTGESMNTPVAVTGAGGGEGCVGEGEPPEGGGVLPPPPPPPPQPAVMASV